MDQIPKIIEISNPDSVSPTGLGQHWSVAAPVVIRTLLTEDQLSELSHAIVTEDQSNDYDFHEKVLLDAKLFLEKKLIKHGFKTPIKYLPKNAKACYIVNTAEETYSRLWLDLSFSWYQTKIPKKIMMKLVSDLNKEFNLERRYGLFLLEEYSDSYHIFFNPNEVREEMLDFSKQGRQVARLLAADTFHPFDRLNEEEIFNLRMENALLETVLAKDPKSAISPKFNIVRNNGAKALSAWINDPSVRVDLTKEIAEWNLENNVEKRAGVFHHMSYGSYFHLWFQSSEGNQGLEDLKKELLTDKAIANVESKYDVVYENRTECTH